MSENPNVEVAEETIDNGPVESISLAGPRPEFVPPMAVRNGVIFIMLLVILEALVSLITCVQVISGFHKFEEGLWSAERYEQSFEWLQSFDWMMAEPYAALSSIVSLICIFSFLVRSNKNARALGAEGMRFSPAGTVGWFFVPLANLVQPGRILSEIWRASHRPGDWLTAEVPAGIPLLAWLLCLACFIYGKYTDALFSAPLDSSEALYSVYYQSIIYGILELARAAVWIFMVRAICASQMNARRLMASADVFGSPTPAYAR